MGLNSRTLLGISIALAGAVTVECLPTKVARQAATPVPAATPTSSIYSQITTVEQAYKYCQQNPTDEPCGNSCARYGVTDVRCKDPCYKNPEDPKCDPNYCVTRATEPFCSDNNYCLTNPNDPYICINWNCVDVKQTDAQWTACHQPGTAPAPSQPVVAVVISTPLAPANTGGAIVTAVKPPAVGNPVPAPTPAAQSVPVGAVNVGGPTAVTTGVALSPIVPTAAPSVGLTPPPPPLPTYILPPPPTPTIVQAPVSVQAPVYISSQAPFVQVTPKPATPSPFVQATPLDFVPTPVPAPAPVPVPAPAFVPAPAPVPVPSTNPFPSVIFPQGTKTITPSINYVFPTATPQVSAPFIPIAQLTAKPAPSNVVVVNKPTQQLQALQVKPTTTKKPKTTSSFFAPTAAVTPMANMVTPSKTATPTITPTPSKTGSVGSAKPTKTKKPTPTKKPTKPSKTPKWDKDGYDKNGYDKQGYNRQGYNKKGYNMEGYDRQGYNKKGYNREGCDREGYDKQGYSKEGYDREGYNRKGYDVQGCDREGYCLDDF